MEVVLKKRLKRKITTTLFHDRRHQGEKSDHIREGSSYGFFLGVDTLIGGNRIIFLSQFEAFLRNCKGERSILDVKENSTSNYTFLRIEINSAKIIFVAEAFNVI